MRSCNAGCFRCGACRLVQECASQQPGQSREQKALSMVRQFDWYWKLGTCGKAFIITDVNDMVKLLTNERGGHSQMPTSLKDVFGTATQRRLKAAAANSIAELLHPEGVGHMAVSHMEDSFDRLVSKVRMAQLPMTLWRDGMQSRACNMKVCVPLL